MSAIGIASVGSILLSMADLDALPDYSVVLGDAEGLSADDRERRIAIQKRPDVHATSGSWWYPAWDTEIFNALASQEVVERFHLGQFLVLHVPDAEMVAEAAT